MPRYVAFLRAINVGGRFMKMASLAEHFRSLGQHGVETFLNSGNVIFQSRGRNPARLSAALEQGLEPLLGFKSEVFVRPEEAVHAIAAQALALSNSTLAPPEVNVAFLGQPLEPSAWAGLAALTSATDTFAAHGTEVYWLCAVKQSESAFSNAVFERKTKVRTTFRRATMLCGLSAHLKGASG